MTDRVLIRLDWPPRALWPNVKDKAHWRDTAKAKKAAKNSAFWQMQGQRHAIRDCEHRHLTLTFYPPTNRKFDLDNAFAAMKAQLDAVRDLWGVDDCEWTFTLERGEKTKGGCVLIEIGPRIMDTVVPYRGKVS